MRTNIKHCYSENALDVANICLATTCTLKESQKKQAKNEIIFYISMQSMLVLVCGTKAWKGRDLNSKGVKVGSGILVSMIKKGSQHLKIYGFVLYIILGNASLKQS